MPKKMGIGDIVIMYWTRDPGPHRVFWKIFDKTPHRHTRKHQQFDIELIVKEPRQGIARSAAREELRYVCKHCFCVLEAHAKNKKCLFASTHYERLKEEDLRGRK